MITSESPATQRRSFFFGVNVGFAGGFATAGFGVVLVVGFGFVRRRRGSTIATSICVGVVSARDALDELPGPVEQKCAR